MKFASLSNLHLLWLLLLTVIFYIYTFRKHRQLLCRWGEFPLVNKLIQEVSFTKRKLKVFLTLSSMLFIILALTQPQWGYHWQEMKRRGIDIIIALDTSKSMLADDVKPNRLSMAKREIEDLIKLLGGDRIGLVTFAGTSFLQCPLTLDYGAFRLFLDTIDTDIIPQGGTDIGGAIRKCLKAFGKESKKHRAIILITDGEDHRAKAETAAKEAKNQAVPIYVVGIGTKEGVPIPIVDKEGNRTYLKDRNGNIVLSKMDDLTLKKIALTTGGVYISASGGAMALDKIYEERISKLEKRELESARRKIYESRYQWPLAIALLLLVLEGIIGERKR